MDKLLPNLREQPSTPDSGDLLNSWKEIAHYLSRGIRTVQRWEAELGLPVRRPRGMRRSAVIATRSDIDDWLSASPGRMSERDVSMSRSEAHPEPERRDVVHRFSLLSPQARATLNRFQIKFRQNMDDFIQAEVETGCTFASVALEAGDATKRARTLYAAHKAYRTAYRSFLKYGVGSPELRSAIVDRMADLRALLEGGRGSTEAHCAVLEILERESRVRAARAGGSPAGLLRHRASLAIKRPGGVS